MHVAQTGTASLLLDMWNCYEQNAAEAEAEAELKQKQNAVEH